METRVLPERCGKMGNQRSFHRRGHIQLTLLKDAGFIQGKTPMDEIIVSRLTWDGHEFLDNIRDPGIWARTLERIKPLQGVALAVIAEVAKSEIKKRVGLP